MHDIIAFVLRKYLNLIDWMEKHPVMSLWAAIALIVCALVL